MHPIDIQAAYYGHPEIVKYLLDYHEMFDFSSNVKDNYGILLRFKTTNGLLFYVRGISIVSCLY